MYITPGKKTKATNIKKEFSVRILQSKVSSQY